MPAGLVTARVNQLGGSEEHSGSSMIETLKKQKRGTNQTARSVATAEGSPAGRHENIMSELPGSRATRGSSRAS